MQLSVEEAAIVCMQPIGPFVLPLDGGGQCANVELRVELADDLSPARPNDVGGVREHGASLVGREPIQDVRQVDDIVLTGGRRSQRRAELSEQPFVPAAVVESDFGDDIERAERPVRHPEFPVDFPDSRLALLRVERPRE